MPRAIDCTIEHLHVSNEEIWIISVPAGKAADVIVVFAAFHLEKTNTIQFADRRSRQSVRIERTNQSAFLLSLNDKPVSISKTWLEAVAAMLTDVALYGWLDTAHLDADFDCGTETVAVCVKVEPPENQH